MSRPSTEKNDSVKRSREVPKQTHETLTDRLTPESYLTPLRTVSFWVAVAMPFLYLPLLGIGIDTPVEVVAFLSMVALNVAALVVGHSHNN